MGEAIVQCPWGRWDDSRCRRSWLAQAGYLDEYRSLRDAHIENGETKKDASLISAKRMVEKQIIEKRSMAMAEEKAAEAEEASQAEHSTAPLSEVSRDDLLWVANNIAVPDLEFKHAPSKVAWSIYKQAKGDSMTWRDIQKILTSHLAKEEKREDDSESLDLTGMAESIREGFGDLWKKVYPILKKRTPSVL